MDRQKPAAVRQEYPGRENIDEPAADPAFLCSGGAASYDRAQTGRLGASVAGTDPCGDDPVFLCIRHYGQSSLSGAGMGKRGAHS